MESLTRREFLKTIGLFSFSLLAPKVLKAKSWMADNEQPQNVLIIVFDAFSARNISLYGYPRKTTPNIDRLAEKAIVYHNHFAGSNFTTPGTASLLTGTLPWSHRALKHADTVADDYVNKTIFNVFSGYHRMAYSHNTLADTLLRQFRADIDDLTPHQKLLLQSDRFVDTVFTNDSDISSVAWYRTVKTEEEGSSYSLFLSRLYNSFRNGRVEEAEKSFPRGIPRIKGDNAFLLEDAIDWVQFQITKAPKPYLGYFHFLPPHFPYKTRQEFFNAFAKDGYHPIEKPDNIFKTERSADSVEKFRRWYDEYLLYVDAEFARLYEFMEVNGLLENTWLILTSDHGEMFERGIVGHQVSAFYQPLLHIPLLIFAPGQTSRMDIYNYTSAVDVLPTLAFLNGREMPAWTEGIVLPPFETTVSELPRDICALRAKFTNKNEPILRASAMLTRAPYKLTYMFGYDKPVGVQDMVELYDLENDPEEMNDLSTARKDLADPMLKDLIAKIENA